MRVLVAPDKFKGSLTAGEAASAIAEGVRRVYPEATVIEFPIADGGEGTLDAAYRAGFEKRLTTVVGPIGKPINAEWALRKDASGAISALIETAQASGLGHMPRSSRNALHAHSYGCGQLITAALDAGATEVIVGLGGSAMSDGGMGAIRALGLSVLDSEGRDVPLGGGGLSQVAAVNAAGLDSRLADTRLRLAVDVRNPLHGPNGAAHVFGPQKGATPSDVSLLDSGLRNWAAVLRIECGRETDIPGAGAAGGFPAPFLTLTNASMEGGFALVAELTGLARELRDADLVITGEGSLDVQSLEGKAPIALAQSARLHRIPVLVLAGRILVSAEDMALHGVTAAAQLLDRAKWASGVPDEEDALTNAALYLRSATAHLLSESGRKYSAEARHRRGHKSQPETAPDPTRKHNMKILLAGDSTVATCPTYEYPMSGWGAQLPQHVYSWAAVHNFAKGGASTESFREEGLWGQLLEIAEAGDLVLIQFGHNDQKNAHLPARIGYAANLRTMVVEVRARGAVPVLCTSVERRHFLDGAGAHAVLEESLEDYPDVVREIGHELQLPVIDLNSWTRALYVELGVAESKSLFCHFGPGEHAFWPAGLADNTHFAQNGASLVAAEVAAQLRLLGLPDRSDSLASTAAGRTAAEVRD